jgi:hypothetical protein
VGALAIAFLPALLVRGSPLAPTLAVTIPMLVLSTYGAGRIDWLRVLKDFGVQESTVMDLPRLGLCALALALAWGIHVLDMALRLRTRSTERGISPEQVAPAAWLVARAGVTATGIATLCTVGVALLAYGAIALGALAPASKAAFIAPVLAALLLAGAGVWLARTS